MCSHCEVYRQAWSFESPNWQSGPPICKATHEIADDRHTADARPLITLEEEELEEEEEELEEEELEEEEEEEEVEW